MKKLPLVLVAGFVAAGTSCAGRQTRIIEPGAEETTAGGPGAPGGGQARRDDNFVLSRKPVAAKSTAEDPLLPVHTGELWCPFRAQFLGFSDAKTRERDAAV